MIVRIVAVPDRYGWFVLNDSMCFCIAADGFQAEWDVLFVSGWPYSVYGCDVDVFPFKSRFPAAFSKRQRGTGF